MRALCASLPSDWWDLGDPGNRLALALCSVCPALKLCPSGDPEPHGVIRGGVAWGDDGERLPLCPCGYPTPYEWRAQCYRCLPSKRTVIPRAKHRGRPRLADKHVDAVAQLAAQGWSQKRIGEQLGIARTTVGHWIRQFDLRPRAVSTEEDAA